MGVIIRSLIFSAWITVAFAVPDAPSVSETWPILEESGQNANSGLGLESVPEAKSEINKTLPIKLAETTDTVPSESVAPSEKPSIPKGIEESTAEVESNDKTSWTKKIGKNISLRATEEQLYIRAGESLIVLDQSGKVTIQSAQTLSLESKKDILFKSGGDIRFSAGGKLIQSTGN